MHWCEYGNDGWPYDTTVTYDTVDVNSGLLITEGTTYGYWYSYSYNINNELDTAISYDDNTGLPLGRDIYFYTVNGKDSVFIHQNFQTPNWINAYEHLYFYDSLDRKIQFFELSWNVNVWVTDVTHTYTYSGNNLLSEYNVPGQTTNSELFAYQYDTATQWATQITVFDLLPDSAGWDTASTFETFGYDSLGRLVYDGIATGFLQFIYDANGHLIGTSGFGVGGGLTSSDYLYGPDSIIYRIIETSFSGGGGTGTDYSDCWTYNIGSSHFFLGMTPGWTTCSNDTIQFDPRLIVGGPVAAFSWSPSAGLSNDSIASPQVFPDSTTTYHLVATDTSGNIFTDSVLVVVKPAPVISFTANGPISFCYGDSVRLTAASSISIPDYNWYDGNSLKWNMNDSSYRITSSGNYWVKGYAINGCKAVSDTIHVFCNPASQATFQFIPGNHVCDSDTVQIRASWYTNPTRNYQWFLDSVPMGITDSIIFVTTAGHYQIVVTSDTSACVDTSDYYSGDVTFSPKPTPQIFPGHDTGGCPNSNVLVTYTNNPLWTFTWYLNGQIWNWNNDSVFANVLNNTHDYYKVLASNNGCKAFTDSILIFTFPAINFNIVTNPPPPFCPGETIQLSTSVPSTGTYYWFDFVSQTSSNDSVVYVDSTTSYSVVIKDSNNCSRSAFEAIVFDSLTMPLVISQNGSLLIPSVIGNVMQWYFNGIAIPGATNHTYTPTQSGFYSVDVNSAAGCTYHSPPYFFSSTGIPQNSSGFMNVTLFPSPTVSEDIQLSYYMVQESGIQIRITDQTGKLIFVKDFGNQNSGTHSEYLRLPENLSTGIYFVNVHSENGNANLRMQYLSR